MPSIILAWLADAVMLAQYIMGTVVLSSILFVRLDDAVSIALRYILSALVMRFIVAFELEGLKQAQATRKLARKTQFEGSPDLPKRGRTLLNKNKTATVTAVNSFPTDEMRTNIAYNQGGGYGGHGQPHMHVANFGGASTSFIGASNSYYSSVPTDGRGEYR